MALPTNTPQQMDEHFQPYRMAAGFFVTPASRRQFFYFQHVVKPPAGRRRYISPVNVAE
jgi:hypothetical protein